MAENQLQTLRRIPRVKHVPTYGIDPRTGNAVQKTRMVTFYDYAIMQLPTHGMSRVPVAIIEDATYNDARDFLAAPRTESGHSKKGFKKLKQPKS